MPDINTTQTAQAVYLVDPATGSGSAPGQSRPAASFGAGQVSVGTSASLVIAARANRNAITITNVTGTQPIYFGPTSAVTTGNGHFLPGTVGASLTLPFSGAIYGIAVGSPQVVSMAETYG